jgi:integrase
LPGIRRNAVRRSLTAKFVETAPGPKDGADRVLYWDASAPGFGLLIMGGGRRSWVFQYRHAGRSRRITWRTPSLAEARKQALEWRDKLDRGADPQGKQAEDDTFAAVAKAFIRTEGRRLRSAGQYQRLLDRLVVPVLGKHPIGTIKRSEITAMLDNIAEANGEASAKLALAVVRRVLNWHAARSDDFTSPVVRGMGPKTNGDGSRERILSDDELRRIWGAGDRPEPFGAYVRFTLLTACRRMEAAAMTWAEVEGGPSSGAADGAVWIIPGKRYKTKREHVVPLSSAAVDALASLPRIGPGKYVFTLTGATPMGGISNRKAAFDQRCGVKDWTLHDLRRTARSLMSRVGVAPYVAEKCLGHVAGAIERTYDRHSYIDEKREAFAKLADEIAKIVEVRS